MDINTFGISLGYLLRNPMIFEGPDVSEETDVVATSNITSQCKDLAKTSGKKNLKRNPEQSFHPHHFWLFIHLFDP